MDFLDKGSYGQVLTVADVNDFSAKPLVMKVMTSHTEFIEEVTTMRRVHKYAMKTQDTWHQKECPVPSVVDCGYLFQESPKHKSAQSGPFSISALKKAHGDELSIEDLKLIGKVNPYIIMPRYGSNLADFFVDQGYYLSPASVLDLGCRVVEQLRAVHRAGYVYNDLKPDNIML